MAFKQMLLIGALGLSAACWQAAARAEEPAAAIDPTRAEALSRKIDEINSQLTKLDQIVEQLRRLRTEELPKLQKEVRGTGEASVLVKNGEQTKNGEHTVQKPEAAGAPDGATDKTNAAPQQTLEAQLTAVQERLQ